ncbi:MAG: HD domain-containing protein [Anaerolineales bacterium]|nr:MAG: HD domain-containing protein [Anaerolineales bacterium]
MMITVEEASRLYLENDVAHDFDHVLRVLALAEGIGQEEGANLEIVRAAALLHDIGGRQRSFHARTGAQQAREILQGHPPEKVEAVAQAIATHSFREKSTPQTLEAQVLYDADKLDAIGAIGVARAYAVSGQMGHRLWAPVSADYQGEARGTPEHTAVHEFVFKLSRLKETLFTPRAKVIAEERHRYMVGFFARLEREVKGEL